MAERIFFFHKKFLEFRVSSVNRVSNNKDNVCVDEYLFQKHHPGIFLLLGNESEKLQ